MIAKSDPINEYCAQKYDMVNMRKLSYNLYYNEDSLKNTMTGVFGLKLKGLT